ncbi:hypothetical protein [Nonomuraea aridisoli]|uniref:hypothetical protein n=1 Tax=Nonomuraea aridisoli TaxID=2070368 RepID=UPI0011B93892
MRAIEALRALDPVAPGRVGVVGASQGMASASRSPASSRRPGPRSSTRPRR